MNKMWLMKYKIEFKVAASRFKLNDPAGIKATAVRVVIPPTHLKQYCPCVHKNGSNTLFEALYLTPGLYITSVIKTGRTTSSR